MATALILAKESYQVKKNCTDAERYAYTRNRGVKEFSEIKIIRECRCPNCKQILRHAGNVFRRIRLEVEDIYYKLPLLKCACGRRRGLIEGMLPHKHYGTDVILKVAEIVLGERKKEAASQLVHACLSCLPWIEHVCSCQLHQRESSRYSYPQ